MQTARAEGFKITNGKGFHITFPNGYTASIQWGWGNYCDNYDFGDGYKPYEERMRESGAKGSSNAEAAFWEPHGTWYHPACLEENGDDVYPRLTTMQVLSALNEIAAMPPKEAL